MEEKLQLSNKNQRFFISFEASIAKKQNNSISGFLDLFWKTWSLIFFLEKNRTFSVEKKSGSEPNFSPMKFFFEFSSNLSKNKVTQSIQSFGFHHKLSSFEFGAFNIGKGKVVFSKTHSFCSYKHIFVEFLVSWSQGKSSLSVSLELGSTRALDFRLVRQLQF